MADRSEYLVAVVGADVTQFRKSMRDVRNELGLLAHEGSGFKEAFRKAGEALTYAVSAPLAVLGGSAVMAASGFESAMRNVNSIAFLTEETFASLKDEVFDFGKTTRDGATGAAEALYTIYSAGMQGASAMYVMEAATKTAEAGLADINTTSEGLVATMLAYGFTTQEEATRASDALTRMVQVGVGSMQAFAGSIATFLPSAAALRVSMEEAFGINAMLTQFGYSASEAAVRTNAAMRSMIKPSEAMEAAIRKLGAGSAKELIEKFGGLSEALFALRGTTDGTEESLAKMFSDTRALQGVLLLTQNIDRTRDTLAGFTAEVDGATDKAREQQMLSFAYSWDTLKTAMQAAGIVLGERIMPMLRPIISQVREFFLGITELDKRTLGFIITGGALVAALGPALWLFSSMLSPISLVAAAVVGLVDAITKIPGVAEAAALTIKAISDALGPVVTMVDELITKLFAGDEVLGGDGPIGGLSSAVDEATSSLNGFRYEVKQGDTLWDIWNKNVKKTGVTFDDFMASIGRTSADSVIHVGDIIDFGGGGNEKIKKSVGGLKSAIESVLVGDFWNKGGPTFFDTLFDGVSAIGDQLGIQLLAARPKIDRALGGFFMYLGNIFNNSSNTGGNTPVFQWIKKVVDSILGLPTELSNSMPQLTTGIGQFFSGLWTWFTTEAIPTAARTIGYVFGKVVSIFSGAIQGLLSWLNGGGAGDAANGMRSFFEDSIAKPFLEGFGQASLGDVAKDGLEGKQANTFDRIVAFISGELQRILPALDTAITNFLNGVSAMFAGTADKDGETGVYKGIRGAFSYLFTGGLATDIEGADLNLTTAFGKLLANLGQWLVNDGVQTIARSLGYLVGTLGVAIGQAFGMLGGVDGGAGNALADSVLTPLAGGFNDAMSDFGMTDLSLGDKIVTGIAGALAISAATGILWTKAVAAIGVGLSLAFKGARWAAGAALNFLDGFVQSVAGLDLGSVFARSMTAEGLGQKVGRAAYNLVDALQYGFRQGGISGAWTMLGTTFIGEWAKSLKNLAIGVYSGVVTAIGSVLSAAISATAATAGWALSAASGLLGVIAAAIPVVGGVGLGLAIGAVAAEALKNLPGLGETNWDVVVYDPTVTFAPFSEGGWSEIGAALGGLLNSKPFTITSLPASIAKVDMQIAPGQFDAAVSSWEEQYGTYFRENGVDLDFWDVFNIIPPAGSTFEEVTGMQKFNYGGIEVIVPISTSPLAATTLATDVKEVAISTEVKSAAASLGQSILENAELFMTDNKLDQTKVTDSFVTPLLTVFNAGFGPEGTVSMVWSTFYSTFAGIATDMEGRVTTMSTELPNSFQILNDAIFPKIDALIAKLGELVTAALTANDSLNLVTGGGGSGGGGNVPLPAGSGNGPTNRVEYVQNTVTLVTRASSGPEIVKELERNGVYLRRNRG